METIVNKTFSNFYGWSKFFLFIKLFCSQLLDVLIYVLLDSTLLVVQIDKQLKTLFIVEIFGSERSKPSIFLCNNVTRRLDHEFSDNTFKYYTRSLNQLSHGR